MSDFAQLLSNISTEQERDILDVLGGIQSVLEKQNEHNLIDKEQMNSLKNILQKEEISRDRAMTQNIYKQENTFTVYMYTENNVLRKIFKTETAIKMESIIRTKLWLLAAIIPLIATFIAGSLHSNGIITAAISYGISLPFNITFNIWLISHLVMLNLSMAKRLVFTFDFVYKIFNALLCIICTFIINVQQSDIFTTFPVLTVFWAILVLISVILTIALISSLDGWKVSVLFKMVFLGIFVFIMMLYGILSYFTFPEHLLIILGHTVSIRAVFLNGIFTVFLFFGKQLYAVWYYRNTEQCGCLFTNPKLKWVQNTTNLVEK